MTNEQRRYKITRKQSYESLSEDEERKAVIKAIGFGLSAAAAAICFGAYSNSDIDAELRIMDVVLGMLNTGFSVYHLKGLIEALIKKTMYRSKIEEIKDELDMPEDKKEEELRLARK